MAKDLSSKSGKERVAVKRIAHDNPRVQENNWTETYFLATSKHPNIVEFKKAYLVKDEKKGIEEMWVVMEYLEARLSSPLSTASHLSPRAVPLVRPRLQMRSLKTTLPLLRMRSSRCALVGTMHVDCAQPSPV